MQILLAKRSLIFLRVIAFFSIARIYLDIYPINHLYIDCLSLVAVSFFLIINASKFGIKSL